MCIKLTDISLINPNNGISEKPPTSITPSWESLWALTTGREKECQLSPLLVNTFLNILGRLMGWQKEIKSMKTVNKAVKLSLFLCEKNGYENNPKKKNEHLEL